MRVESSLRIDLNNRDTSWDSGEILSYPRRSFHRRDTTRNRAVIASARSRDDRQVRRPVVDERLITAGLISFVVAAGIYTLGLEIYSSSSAARALSSVKRARN